MPSPITEAPESGLSCWQSSVRRYCISFVNVSLARELLERKASVHADILDIATHAVASLRDKIIRGQTESFPRGKVSRFSRSAYLHF